MFSRQTPSSHPASQTQALSFGTLGRSLHCASLDPLTCQKSNGACLTADRRLEDARMLVPRCPSSPPGMPSRAGPAAYCRRGTRTRRAGSAPCRLLSELHSCPLHADRPRGLVRSSAHLSFLLAFEREALIRNSTEARNVSINHGFPYGGLILEVFSRVAQISIRAVHQSSGQHASMVP